MTVIAKEYSPKPVSDIQPNNAAPESVWSEDYLPPLRPPDPTGIVDPAEISPQPGSMGQLYIDMRARYPDGMSLACATPLRPYSEIVADYEAQKDLPDFSGERFWSDNFITPAPDDAPPIARPHQNIDSYIRDIRQRFIHTNDDNTEFDIWLPHDRSVAGAGRFGKHSFLWDGYQMAKGYAADNRWDLVQNIVDNTEYQINTFGYALNGSAKFYATRSQPPYFSHEVSLLADRYGDEALIRYLPALEKEYKGYWMSGKDELAKLPDDGKPHGKRSLVRLPIGNGKFVYLNRYWDDGDGPRLESYKEDVDLGELATEGLKGAIKQRRLQKLYKDVRAAAASGWDFSSRWLEDGHSLETINTTNILPIDLNSLLARYEQVLAQAHLAAGHIDQALDYSELARQRVEAINLFNWDNNGKTYHDYNFAKAKQTAVESAAMAYPLYVGIANANQALGVRQVIEQRLLFSGGVVATTNAESRQQWDGGKIAEDCRAIGQMNVWAPPNWAAARGLARMAHMLMDSETDAEPLFELAESVRSNYMHGIETVFEKHRIIPEKHRGENPAKLAGGGEYALVKALAMPGETYRAMKEWNPRDPDNCRPVGSLALRNIIVK